MMKEIHSREAEVKKKDDEMTAKDAEMQQLQQQLQVITSNKCLILGGCKLTKLAKGIPETN